MVKFIDKFESLNTTTIEPTATIPGDIFCFAAMYQHRTPNVMIAMSATSDPDTMYYHEAMREPDAQDFIEAVKKEFTDLLDKGVFTFIERSKVPKGATLFPSVWAMKRKRRVKTREIYKWKARLNLDGSKQVAGENYDQTYAPVAS